MKTIRLFGMMLMAVLLSFSMTACGDDDDDDDSGFGGGSSYKGDWVVEKSRNFPSYPSEIIVLTLNSNTWKIRSYSAQSAQEIYKYVASGTLSVSGSKVKVIGGDSDVNGAEGNWSVSGNTLTITYNENGKQKKETYQRLTSEESKIIATWDKVAKDETVDWGYIK